MLIDFEKLPESVLHQFKDGVGDTRAHMHTDELNRIMLTELAPGVSIGLHTHDTSSEIIYILSGRGKALFDGGEEPLYPGVCHYCPKGSSHSVINDGDQVLRFFAVVPQQ